MLKVAETQEKLNAAPPKLLYNTDEAAYMLGLKPKTLRDYRNTGRGPNYIKTSTKHSLVLYPYDELVAWVEKLKQKGWK